jgi:hypothetical protein
MGHTIHAECGVVGKVQQRPCVLMIKSVVQSIVKSKDGTVVELLNIISPVIT